MATIKGLLALFFKPSGPTRFVQYTAGLPTTSWSTDESATTWSSGRVTAHS